MDEMQPIETAPKDGTPILAYGGEQNYYEPKMDGSRPSGFVVIWWDIEDSEWRFCSYDGGYYGEWIGPEKWMPLPTVEANLPQLL